MNTPPINAERLLGHLRDLDQIGRDDEGRLVRLAGSDADEAASDAQMIAQIAPSAMIFVPSTGGISHNPREHTPDADLVAGANILLDVVSLLAAQ